MTWPPTVVEYCTRNVQEAEKLIDDNLYRLQIALGNNIAEKARVLSMRYPRRRIEVSYINGSFSVEVQSWPKPSMWHVWGLWIDFQGEWETVGPDRLIPHLEAMAQEWLETREKIEHRVYPMIEEPVTYLQGGIVK